MIGTAIRKLAEINNRRPHIVAPGTVKTLAAGGMDARPGKTITAEASESMEDATIVRILVDATTVKSMVATIVETTAGRSVAEAAATTVATTMDAMTVEIVETMVGVRTLVVRSAANAETTVGAKTLSGATTTVAVAAAVEASRRPS